MKRLLALGLGLGMSMPVYAANVLDDRVKAIAGMIVLEDVCEIAVNNDAVATYMSSAFDDIGQATASIDLTVRITRNEAAPTGLERTVRCAGLERFAEENGLLVSPGEAVGAAVEEVTPTE